MQVMVFDGDCAFCSSSVDVARRVATAGIVFVPYQTADLESLGIDRATCEAVVQYRDRDGRWHAGSDAVAMLLRESGMVWWLPGWVLMLPGVRVVASRVYAWVARNRHRLPGGTPACQRFT